MIVGGSPLAVLGLGFALGLRHALDVDHLAAVSTIVGARRSLWWSAIVGVTWGLGHTAALVAVAIGVIALHAEIPPGLGHALELGVAAMLMVLGGRLLGAVLRGDAVHSHPHVHAGRAHHHLHLHPPGPADHDHGPRNRRPFWIGAMHGLAGSGGLMLAVVATVPDPVLAIAYVAVFGIGSIGGMAVMSTLFAIPSTLVGGGGARWLGAAAALASLVVGVELAWEIGRESGWLA
jgi:high-affinity nickel-transport protein